MEFHQILEAAVNMNASDIHLKHHCQPHFRVAGILRPWFGAEKLSGEKINEFAQSIMAPHQQKKFQETHEVDTSYTLGGHGRFRINIFLQQQMVGMVIRHIPEEIKDLKALNLPKATQLLTTFERGLVLVTGVSGSGKSTTLAAIIDEINESREGHILTIEDPVEFLFKDKKCIVNQRELGLDTPSFDMALRQSLRQDPDVIYIGEMRDAETISTALMAAETGHLVFSTLHTANSSETISRVLSHFEPHQEQHLRYQLAGSLKAVVSQRLVRRVDGKGLAPVCEIMVVNERIREMIIDRSRTIEIPEVIAESSHMGMQSFDQNLMELLKQGLITFDEAKAAATNVDDFILQCSGVTN